MKNFNFNKMEESDYNKIKKNIANHLNTFSSTMKPISDEEYKDLTWLKNIINRLESLSEEQKRDLLFLLSCALAMSNTNYLLMHPLMDMDIQMFLKFKIVLKVLESREEFKLMAKISLHRLRGAYSRGRF